MKRKTRPASKAFTDALAKQRREVSRPIEKPQREDLRSPTDKFLDWRGHPKFVRAFGFDLERGLIETQAGGRPVYRGGSPGCRVSIWQNGIDRWIASIELGVHAITPDRTSSSIPAAIRNLRGHLLNLELDLGKLLHPRKNDAKKKG